MLALTACVGTTPRLVNNVVQFPDINVAWKPQGTVVSGADMAKVKAGMTKQQVYDTLGVPHVNNGFTNEVYWDYFLVIKTPVDDQNCQLVIEYADQAQRLTALIKTLHWKDAARCARLTE